MKITRRELLYGGGCVVAASALTGTFLWRKRTFVPPDSIEIAERPKELEYLSSVVDRQGKWGPGQLFKFVNALSDAHLAPLGASLEIERFEDKSKPSKVEAIHREILWQSSSIFTYPVKSLEDIDYHDLVVWCANKVNIPKSQARFTSSFDLERQIVEKQFVELWDKLDEQQRTELLRTIDPSGEIEDAAAIVAMSGTAALAALSATVYFSGFAFYTTMSVVICTVAGWFGVTLPFAAYMTASSTMAVLTGPIGWAIGAICLAGAIAAWAGQANIRKTTATVMQLHCMKAGALYGAGET